MKFLFLAPATELLSLASLLPSFLSLCPLFIVLSSFASFVRLFVGSLVRWFVLTTFSSSSFFRLLFLLLRVSSNET